MKIKSFGLAENVTLVHFFLMFGYKLFSLYFPLFLVEKNFSILEIGYTSFLIYVSIALFSPLAGYLNYKIRPAILMSSGVLGYAIYALAMLFSVSVFWFYVAQVLLGISGALFFVTSRAVLMSGKSERKDGIFAWFYSAPVYAEAIAPAVGALIIWKFGFLGVFLVSLIIQLFASVFAFNNLKKEKFVLDASISFKKCSENYKKVGESIKFKNMGFFVFISFLVLVIAGFNNTFFVLFLKSINWTQNEILLFNSLVSLGSLPVSFLIARKLDRQESEKNICSGGQIVGLFTIILGLTASILNVFSVFIIMLCKNAGALVTNSGRSALMGVRLKTHINESATIDTIFSPLSTAFGALAGGFLISAFGYPILFIFIGLIILLFSLIGNRIRG